MTEVKEFQYSTAQMDNFYEALVRFVGALTLCQELELARAEHRLPKYLKSYDKYNLVIIDELGYLGLGVGGQLLFQFMAERYERRSVVITTSLEFGRWVEVFSDTALTTALLDRLTHHCHVVVFDGDSYRFKQSQKAAENHKKGRSRPKPDAEAKTRVLRVLLGACLNTKAALS